MCTFVWSILWSEAMSTLHTYCITSSVICAPGFSVAMLLHKTFYVVDLFLLAIYVSALVLYVPLSLLCCCLFDLISPVIMLLLVLDIVTLPRVSSVLCVIAMTDD